MGLARGEKRDVDEKGVRSAIASKDSRKRGASASTSRPSKPRDRSRSSSHSRSNRSRSSSSGSARVVRSSPSVRRPRSEVRMYTPSPSPPRQEPAWMAGLISEIRTNNQKISAME
eukprot:8773060-Pyramimonas_sp.AAC.1